VAKKELSLQYSGYAIFAAKLISVATGFAFQVMFRSAVSGTGYSIYYNIGDFIAYFTLMAGVVPFWVMRYVARGKDGAIRTGVATNFVISIVGTIAYLAIVPLVLPLILPDSTNYLPLYLIAGMQITEYYSISIFETCLQAYKPQAVGFGLLIQQISKITIGYVLIVLLGQGVLGAIIVTAISFVVQIAFYYALLFRELKQQIQWRYIREWFKGSVGSIYSFVGSQIANLSVILLFVYGGVESRGIYAAAFIIANIIAYSSFLSFALYPKLLAEKNQKDATTSIKMVLMFALPMATGAIALAESYMGLLDYGYASMVLVVLSFDALITVMGGIYNAVVSGIENVDEDEKLSIRRLVRSRLFLAFSLPYVQAAISLPTIYFVLTTYAFHMPYEATLYVAIINISVHVFTFALLFAISRKMMKISIPWKSVAKYLFASAIMGIVLFLLPHPTTKLLTIAVTAVGGGIYLAILVAIDEEARALPRTILHEIRKKTAKTNEQQC
jgi:hypothetical protein